MATRSVSNTAVPASQADHGIPTLESGTAPGSGGALRDHALEDPALSRPPSTLLQSIGRELGELFVGTAEAAPARGYSPRFVDHYSRHNRNRAERPDTRWIVLHTTEGGDRGSLSDLTRHGEANYMVATDGTIYRIVDRDRISKHAGRSMWNGVRNLENHSVGIEVAGYHNRPITPAQERALKFLVGELQRIYGLSDDKVLTHSMVAYDWNKWEHAYVRGRKKCAMQFADPDLRARLGLEAAPSFDPDVRRGKLKVIDKRLERALYGHSTAERRAARETYSAANANVVDGERTPWSIAGSAFDDHSTEYRLPSGKKVRGDAVQDWGAIPRGTVVSFDAAAEETSRAELQEITNDRRTAWSIAGKEYNAATTIYLLKDGRVRTGAELSRPELDHLEIGTKMLVGYVYGGQASRERTPYEIVGKEWNYPSTYYRLPDGKLISGDELDDGKIKPGTVVLFRR